MGYEGKGAGPIPNLPLPRALGFAGERLGGFPFFLTPFFKIHPAVAGRGVCPSTVTPLLTVVMLLCLPVFGCS